jgi:hypothetical protein
VRAKVNSVATCFNWAKSADCIAEREGLQRGMHAPQCRRAVSAGSDARMPADISLDRTLPLLLGTTCSY